jgi:hypothetical protein
MTLLQPLRLCPSYGLRVDALPSGNAQCDLLTVAFNNWETIERQISFVRKYLVGEYQYIVADNSTDRVISKRIAEICRMQEVPYIRLPRNYLTRAYGGSYSHGTALNWIYRHIILRRKPSCFGFIDHDLFPIRTLDPGEYLSCQPVYGYMKERGAYWYLWAGFCFFRFAYIRGRRMDFLPVKPSGVYLDTGGGNWYSLYSHLDKSALSKAAYHYEMANGDRQGPFSERIAEFFDDAWIHTIDASNWGGEAPDVLHKRRLALETILAGYL